MIRRFLMVLGFVAFVTVCILGIVSVVRSQAAAHLPAAQPAHEPCTVNACIKLTEEDGTVYKLNDFRFQPNSCIIFISMPDNTRRSYCGKYQLDWIGPVGKAQVVYSECIQRKIRSSYHAYIS